ncbi:chromosomal replication initiator protein DnaA [Rhodocaloribacter litoris]|uniref:chromosomal replication initiator protein DnaA n=1 Tax=Rhodocaloribacter litoris TaxID=2558931 RepID=UPI0014222230|nr:chromosomal replication initiator protein DnaA [Rhodocaloribacter litoris]QXD13742.1 chromosomal replication initiator protein DnaA [Rhodocaloribacter litoris]
MEHSPESVWKQCLDIIRDNISRQSFKTWFEPLKAVRLEQDGELIKLTVQLPSQFYYEWLEEHYFALLRKTITKVLGPQGRLFYDIVIEKDDAEGGYEGASVQLPSRSPANEPPPVASGVDRPPPESGAEPATPTSEPPAPSRFGPGGLPPAPITNPFVIPGIRKADVDSRLNAHYTFERFIEGDCNRLARSAALAIAQQPGATSFNPFLVYGGVGLGKTHLIQAIGNYIKANRRTETVLYVSSERFTTEFVQAIQHNRASDFSLFYRQIDLLIIDDVQFFGGKEKTQEEFFHIFNALHQSGKQIVLSADRPPRDIQGIEERLLSRFQWGLSADLQPPELETRIAILRRKAEDEGVTLPDEIIEFVAHHIKSNIRELEGALIRLIAQTALHRRELDLSLAKEILRDLIKESRISLSIEQIQRIVCEYFNIPEDLVRAKTRKREVVQARQVAMYFSKQLTQHSLKTIGLHFGGRDHSTVIHACQSVTNQIETDPKFREIIEEIAHKLELHSR